MYPISTMTRNTTLLPAVVRDRYDLQILTGHAAPKQTNITTSKMLVIVEIGYIAGICFKLTGTLDYVIALYVLNAGMVLIDIGLYRRNTLIMRANSGSFADEEHMSGDKS